MSLSLRALRSSGVGWWLAAAITGVAVAVVVATVDVDTLGRVARQARSEPVALALIGSAYLLAFVLRAVAWRRILPRLTLGQSLAAIHLSLGGNHVLPLRLGEILRITSVVRRANIPVQAAAASTMTLRAVDVATVGAIALVAGPAVVSELVGLWFWPLMAVVVAVVVVGHRWLRRLAAADQIRTPSVDVFVAAVAAWLLEAAVVWQAASWAGVSLTPVEAVLVTSITVAAQTVAIAPAGIGTYEAAATATLVAIGVDASTGLAVAVATHAIKTAYSLIAGGVALAVPAPSMIGRLRLGRKLPQKPMRPADDGPVALFLPAHDEQEAVGEVVARIPSHVLGRPVIALVVDDGSSDDTAGRAAAAGAEVIVHPCNLGLGAAVRRGLAEARFRGAVAVAFCDADGEYAPEELERLLAPILAGDAHYVVGTRFGGEIERMLPHRRLGNLVLTGWVRWMTRLPVSDGQSGYRAFSAEAADGANIAHDFNYAQVLTLDLLRKGFGYHEVPISYLFRRTGRSFVRLGRYLRAVVPAVWRVLNPPSVLHDV